MQGALQQTFDDAKKDVGFDGVGTLPNTHVRNSMDFDIKKLGQQKSGRGRSATRKAKQTGNEYDSDFEEDKKKFKE